MGPCGQTRWLWTILHIRSPVAHHMHCTDQKTEAVDSGREEAHHLHNTDHHTVYERGVDAGHCQPGARVASAFPRVNAEESTCDWRVGGFRVPTGSHGGIRRPPVSLRQQNPPCRELVPMRAPAGIAMGIPVPARAAPGSTSPIGALIGPLPPPHLG